MKKQRLQEIIIDQKETYLNQPYIERNYELDTNINYCFVGIRRCGKSFLMYQLIHNVIETGIDPDRIIYLNFQDERLLEFELSDFDKLLEVSLELTNNKGTPYFYLDEVQLIDGWDRFVRRLADSKYRVCVTGSNSKMLSSEIASTLGGRFMILNVYPYSFMEYLKANNISLKNIGLSSKSKADVSNRFNNYLTYGAFPEIVNVTNKKDYLNSLYQTIYLGDIITRNSLDNKFALRLIIKKIAESITKPISFSRLYGITKACGIEIGKQTVINYINYSLDALLIFNIQNYVSKLVDKETSPKYYFMDTGFLNIFGTKEQKSLQLENLVAIELIRRYGKENIYYFEKDFEIDFYIPDKKIAIQVSYDIDDEETYKREMNAFIKMKTYIPKTKCLLLTINEDKKVNYEGSEIEIMPIYKWLLNG